MQQTRATISIATALLCLTSVSPASAQLDSLLRALLQPPAPPPPAAYPRPRYEEPPRSYAAPPQPQYAPTRPVAARSGATNGDKFCIDNNTTMFLARRSSDSLEFALSAWDARGHSFSLDGTAQPAASGWLYRRDMSAPDLAARCEARIEARPDGGYVFWVTRAGPCSDGQGFAYQPEYRVAFPARSRKGGIPAAKSMQTAGSMERGGESCQAR